MIDDLFDRHLAAWLEDDAEHRVPGHLGEVLELAATTRQRPWWSSPERWLRMDTTFSGQVAPAARPYWMVLVIALALLVASAILFGGGRERRIPAPYGPAGNGSILYSSAGDIHISDADGHRARVLVGDPALDYAPVLAHDGSRFAFFRQVAAGYAVFVADLDGSNVRQLTPTPLEYPTSADWSADDSELLLVDGPAGHTVVSIVAADGSESPRELPLGRIVADQALWLPPGGHEIVFRGTDGGAVSIYRMRVKGTGPRQVGHPVADENAYLGLRVAPDGKRVTYAYNRPADVPGGRKSEIHVLDLASGDEVVVGFDPGSRHETQPKFSPDGTSVLFVRLLGSIDVASLVIAKADGTDGPGTMVGNFQDWTPQGPLDNPVFEFSPDGHTIVLSTGENALQLIDIPSGETTYGGAADFVDWQRAGTAAPAAPAPTP